MVNRRKLVIAKSPRRKKQKRLRSIRRIISIIILFLLAIGIAIGFFYLPFLRIESVEVTGTKELSAKDLVAEANVMSSGKYFMLFPKNNLFLYPKRLIEKTLLAHHQEIKQIKIGFTNFKTAKIILTERMPTSIYCQSKCYYMDQTGYIYREVNNFSDETYAVFRDNRQQFASSTSLGTTTIALTDYQNLLSFYAHLPSLMLKPVDITFASDGQTTVHTKQGDLLVALDHSFDDQLANLQLALASSVFIDSKGKLKPFQYIDLRFDYKLFYKVSGGNAGTATTSTSSVQASSTPSTSSVKSSTSTNSLKPHN